MSKRQPLEQFGGALLVRKKGTDAKEAKGLKIFQFKENSTTELDYDTGVIIWFSDIDWLRAGGIPAFIPVFRSAPYVPAEAAPVRSRK